MPKGASNLPPCEVCGKTFTHYELVLHSNAPAMHRANHIGRWIAQEFTQDEILLKFQEFCTTTKNKEEITPEKFQEWLLADRIEELRQHGEAEATFAAIMQPLQMRRN